MSYDATQRVSFDVETHLIQPGLAAPPLVCGSVAGSADTMHVPPEVGEIVNRDDARQVFAQLVGGTHTIVGANIAYDMIVMAVDALGRGVNLLPQIFEAYRQGRVHDIQITEALHAIGQGHLYFYPDGRALTDAKGRMTKRYSLDNCVRLNLGRENAKENDFWRLRFAMLADTPIEQWPQRAAELRGLNYPDTTATQYPVDDAVNTLEVAQVQVAGHDNLHDAPVQTFKALCLNLGATWGLRTDPKAVAELETAALKGQQAGQQRWLDAGFLQWKKEKGELKCAGIQAAQKRAVALAYGCSRPCPTCSGQGKMIIERFSEKTGKPLKPGRKACEPCNATGLVLEDAPVPMTAPTEKALEKNPAAKGNVKYGRDELFESGDEDLIGFAEWQEDAKITGTYIPFLKKGIDHPVTLRPNPVLKSGRVSFEDVIQLLPRGISARLAHVLREMGSTLQGVRDCFVARPGMVYYSVDYQGGELVSFAESAVARVGFSQMGESLNSGVDVHSEVAAMFLGMSYGDFVANLKTDKKLKAARQAAKPVDFGAPGFIGAPKITLQQRKGGPDTEWEGGPTEIKPGVWGYKGLRFCLLAGRAERCGIEKVTQWGRTQLPPTCKTCIIVAQEIKDALFARYQEIPQYLQWHKQNVDHNGYSIQHYSGRKRGGINVCSGANSDFQALLADIYARAVIRVVVEQYTGRRTICTERLDVPAPHGGTRDASSIFEWSDDPSELWGSHNIAALHDENFGECPEDTAHESAHRVSEIMVEEFGKGCPNHRPACKAEPAIAPRWWKAMEPVYHGGRLVPWTPEHDPKTCVECV